MRSPLRAALSLLGLVTPAATGRPGAPAACRRARRRPLQLLRLEDRVNPVKFFDNGLIALHGMNYPARITEPAVPVYLDGTLLGNFQVVEGYQRVAGTSSYPLVFSDVVANVHSRPTYQKADGTSGTLASSLKATMSFRTPGGFMDIPQVQRADVSVHDNVTTVTVTAAFGDVATEVIALSHPLARVGQTVVNGSVTFVANQDIALDPGLLHKDALRPLMLSTMYVGPAAYDTSALAFVDGLGASQRLRLNGTAGDSHLFAQPHSLKVNNEAFTAVKEPGSLVNPGSPTVRVALLGFTLTPPGGPAAALSTGLQGWREATTDLTHDSVHVWPEALDVPGTIAAGSRLDAVFQAVATPPQALPVPLPPPVVLRPGGTVGDMTPTFAWSPLVGARRYELLVVRAGTGAAALRRTGLTASDFTPAAPLAQGPYRVTVRAFDASGRPGAWAAPRPFLIDVPPPGRPAPAALGGLVPDTTPTFAWGAAANARAYELVVTDLTARGLAFRRVVGATSFTRGFPLPPRHLFHWVVRGINEAGEAGPWSVAQRFQVRPDVLADLAGTRHWVTYAPRAFNPDAGVYPRPDQILADLRQLYAEGWRSVMTWSLDGTLSQVPRIAREVGFSYVAAGLFWFDDAQLARERAAALAAAPFCDAFVVGNEGLQFRPGVYDLNELRAVIDALRQATGKPIATCETGGFLLAHPEVIGVGDFVLANIHPWDAGVRTIPEAVQHTVNEYRAIQNLAPAGKLVYLREAWWPTGRGGSAAANEVNQALFFQGLIASGIEFAFGESYDQPWKKYGNGLPQPLWGLHDGAGRPRWIIAALAPLFRDPH